MEPEDKADLYETDEELADEFGKPRSAIDKLKGKAEAVKADIGERIQTEKDYRAYKKKMAAQTAKARRIDFATRFELEQKHKEAAALRRAKRREAIKTTIKAKLTEMKKQKKVRKPHAAPERMSIFGTPRLPPKQGNDMGESVLDFGRMENSWFAEPKGKKHRQEFSIFGNTKQKRRFKLW